MEQVCCHLSFGTGGALSFGTDGTSLEPLRPFAMSPELTNGRVEVGVDGTRIVMRIVGFANHRLCQPVQEFALAMVSVGYRRFEIDLGVCTQIDSTFIGVLAGLAIKIAPDGG